jgi:hypothetical protein
VRIQIEIRLEKRKTAELNSAQSRLSYWETKIISAFLGLPIMFIVEYGWMMVFHVLPPVGRLKVKRMIEFGLKYHLIITI